jgi:hypothetical protein
MAARPILVVACRSPSHPSARLRRGVACYTTMAATLVHPCGLCREYSVLDGLRFIVYLAAQANTSSE